MEKEGNTILGVWICEMMGAIIKFEFFKEGENQYSGRMLDVEVSEKFRPLMERKLKNGLNLEDLKNDKLFYLNYNSKKKIYEVDKSKGYFSRQHYSSFIRGLRINIEAINLPNSKMELRISAFPFNRRIVLTRENS